MFISETCRYHCIINFVATTLFIYTACGLSNYKINEVICTSGGNICMIIIKLSQGSDLGSIVIIIYVIVNNCDYSVIVIVIDFLKRKLF